MSKKQLGVEFYRNFVGIEKPLKLEITAISNHNWIDELKTCEKLGETCFLSLHGTSYEVNETKEHVKPYLRTIEDLSDDELLNIFIGNDVFKIPFIIIKRDENSVNFFSHNTINHICGWDFNTGNLILKEFFDIQGIQNRLAEKHCHLKAKEYIDNGLALRAEK